MPRQDLIRPAGRAAARSRWEAAGVAAIAAVIIGAYAYFSTSTIAELFAFGKTSEEYYPRLVDGFRRGHLYLGVDPPPELARLADPYDPAQRARIGRMGLHDVSYYRGRYYLYFGAAPAVALFLPFRLLTGAQFPSALATVLFCAGGYLASLGLLLGLRRRFFPECPAGFVWLGAIMLGLGNFCLPMLTRNSIWEVPISSAYFFSALGYWLVFQAWCSDRRRLLRLAAAGAAFGLAAASRPHFVFAAAVAGGFCLWRWRARGWREVAAFGLPVGLIVAGMLAYNYERFGHPFEFGIRYSLGGGSQVRAKLMGWEFWPANLYYNFLAPAQFERYFPFFEVIRNYSGLRPASYAGSEDPYGVLPNMPFWLLALAAPMAWRLRFRGGGGLGAWIVFFGSGFLVLAAPILSFAGSTNRYEVDFLPSLLLQASLGLLMLGSAAPPSRAARGFLRAGVFAVIAYTAVFNVGAAFRHNGMFEAHRPEAYRILASWFNRPAFLWDRWSHQAYGPVEMTVRFPQDRLARAEPLLVTGASYRSDYIYVYYDPDGRSVRLGYTRTNHEQQLSQPIFVDGGLPHRIGIVSGALYPPPAHPYFKGWTPAQVLAAKQTLRVTLDGVPYLEGRHDFFETTPGFLEFGRNDVSAYIDRQFNGAVVSVRRQPPGPAIAPFAGGGFVRAAFVLPAEFVGRKEPLIATGAPGAGDLLFVTGEDAAHVRLGFVHAGGQAILSEPLPVVPDRAQVLEASLGSFYPHPQGADERELARALVVRLNGQWVWAQEQDFHAPGVPAVSFGANSWRSDASAAAFSGRWVAVQPMPSLVAGPAFAPFAFAPYWLEEEAGRPGYGPLRLRVFFPGDQAGKFEPLLVSGPSISQADYLWIRYQEDATHVILGYEHTSGGGPNSGVLPLDLTRPHVVEIEAPSLYPPQGDPYFSGVSLLAMLSDKSRARVRMDGASWIDAPVKAYESTPAQATVGANRVSATFGRRFTGRIVRIERGHHAPPPGFAEQTGALEMAVTWPETPPVGTREAVLATGGAPGRDSLLVEYPDDRHLRLVQQDHQGRLSTGATFAVDPARQATLRIAWGGFFPDAARPATVPPEEWRSRRRNFEVWADGTEVLRGEADFVLAEPQEVGVGIGWGAQAPFSGTIRAVRRLPEGNP